jgi:hypothetical protein
MSSRSGYGSWIYGENPQDTVVYAALHGAEDYSRMLGLVIHEFAHAIGNPLAETWYAENAEFRRWSDDSVDLTRWPQYANGRIMANEYLTRAYTILYMIENTETNLFQLFQSEKASGFPYIQEVYAMITDHEIIADYSSIGAILGVDDYTLGDEQSLNLGGGRSVTWRQVDLSGHEINIDSFTPTEVGDAFGSKTGDVLYVISDGRELLYIDLGSAQSQGWSIRHRMYSVFLLN